MPWREISHHIADALGESFKASNPHPISGGDINLAYLLQDGAQRVFVKLNSASRLAMFTAEQQALLEMQGSNTLRVPRPYCTGVVGSQAFIAMEYVALSRGSEQGQEQLGRQLAAMHQITAPRFGWHRNNTIGSTLQRNDQQDDWVHFWRDQRIAVQLQLLAQNGYSGRIQSLGERLLAALPTILESHHPLPSMLHGDLWSGNYAFDDQAQPLIFDPALYYGDRETDLAMTELFGGFAPRFYAAYREAYPLAEGYAQRRTLYNLYHILNHGNLFGGGYIQQAEGMIEQLL